LIEEICASLPPLSLLDRLSDSATKGAIYGGISGITKLVEQVMTDKGHSQTTVHFTGQTLFYTTLFAIFLNQRSNQNPEAPLSMAFYQAAMDTGMLFMTKTAVNAVSGAVHSASESVKEVGFHSIGTVLGKLGLFAKQTTHAYNVALQGVPETLTGMVFGGIIEQVVEKVGRKLFF
jgi:hypothetical protein